MVVGLSFAGAPLLPVQTTHVSADFVDLLGQSGRWLGVHNVVFVVKNLNVIFASHHVGLVNVNQVTLLVSRQDNFVVHIQVSVVLHNVLYMLGSLHVVLAPVVIYANVGHLLVFSLVIILNSLLVIILVIVVDIWILVVLEFLCQLENYLILLGHILIVGVNEHVLVVVGHVEILLHFLLLFCNCQHHFFFLN